MSKSQQDPNPGPTTCQLCEHQQVPTLSMLLRGPEEAAQVKASYTAVLSQAHHMYLIHDHSYHNPICCQGKEGLRIFWNSAYKIHVRIEKKNQSDKERMFHMFEKCENQEMP